MEEREVHDLVSNTDDSGPDTSTHPDPPEVDQPPAKGDQNPAPTSSPPINALVQQWIDKALHFFSHATNETLGACFVGLGASTYLVLGRVGLVLIGVVGGIALHATWEGQYLGPTGVINGVEKEAKKRRELGLEVVQRVWRWRETRLQGQGDESEQDDPFKEQVQLKMYEGKVLDFSDFQPQTAKALDVFTTAVIRDYVKWWYSPVLPDEEVFPTACRQTLTAFILTMSSHISRKRPTEMFVNFAINSSSIVIAFFAELSAALNASPNSDAVTAIDTYVQLKPDASLSRMLDSEAQDKKLGVVAEDILENFLDHKALNFPPVHTFLHQVLSKLILGMTLNTCSKADWINGWIVYLLEEGEPEIMQVIDESMENSVENPKTASDSDPSESTRAAEHRRHRSQAEEAMDQALQEAQRLTQMIAEEEARKAKSQSINPAISSSDVSEDNTQGIHTPTSSQSESERVNAVPTSVPEVTQPVVAEAAQNPAKPEPEKEQPARQFTDFGQILPPNNPSEESKPVLTLHGAKIAIFDDSMPGEKTRMKSKPAVEYLIQIEPADSRFSGWMIARKFIDFEVLHEVLRRISVIAGVPFTEAHQTLPNWKTLDKSTFRHDLEIYLSDAVKFQQLAESEGMKRFLEKDQGLLKSPSANKGLGWPDPLQMGKGVMDVLTKAPKEVTTGGKALFGGVTNVLTGGKKTTISPSGTGQIPSTGSPSLAGSSPVIARTSADLRSPVGLMRQNGSQESLSRKLSLSQQSTKDLQQSFSSQGSGSGRQSTDLEYAMLSSDSPSRRPSTPQVLDKLNLPPPPSAIDEYEITGGISPAAIDETPRIEPSKIEAPRVVPSMQEEPSPKVSIETPTKPTPAVAKQQAPLTEQEAIVTVDLLFAVISELYTLSSAWTFRRTLLQAARTFLLRPGNPQLEAIRVLIQESVIDANSSDAGIAALILKTRENSLPTEEELKRWPPPLSMKESEALRVKARRLLVERGMPQALTSVMGAAASGEALGKIFDCLQMEKVAHGMMFGLMLQALRAAVQ